MRILAPLALVLVLSACGGTDDDGGDGDGPSSSPSETSDVVLAETEVCDLVRQGIDAFNLGDLDGTVERFETAVPEAEALADDQPSSDTEALLDAVRYYAELPVEDYLEASVSSPEFLRFKDFTLTECAYAAPPVGSSEPALPA
ncbi:hypothetical protein ABFT23_03350 [Nocardioides sp. C4-1]|uniref:hypothetical protein n=1 Tax=Nocardioides sp. C4-1 TaxID=3151851 RepID=UPI0032649C13